jgi:nitrite reductase/ring-hydroxylating ferredoxin subunit
MKAVKRTRVCYWSYDDIEDRWDTRCSHAFCFIEGNPVNNDFVFCPYCGKPISIRKGRREDANP